MTSDELYRLRGIDGEIERLRERIRKARAKATGTVGVLGDVPPSGGTVRDRVGDGVAEILRLEAELRRKERQKAMRDRYIDAISDATTRDALRMIYVDGMSWRAAASAVGKTESGLRKRVRRYMR